MAENREEVWLELLAHCKEGDLEAVKALDARARLRPADGRITMYGANSEGGRAPPPRQSPKGGVHGDVAGTPVYPLIRACESGNMALVAFLDEIFGYTASEVRYDLVSPVRHALLGGHTEIAQWLVARYGLSCCDARADYESTASACPAEARKWLEGWEACGGGVWIGNEGRAWHMSCGHPW